MRMNLLSREIPGLVWAYRFVPGEPRCSRIAIDSSLESLKDNGEGWVWVHLALSDARTPGLIETLFDLPPEVIATLTSHDTQAAVAVTDDIVHGTLVDFERTFDIGFPEVAQRRREEVAQAARTRDADFHAWLLSGQIHLRAIP